AWKQGRLGAGRPKKSTTCARPAPPSVMSKYSQLPDWVDCFSPCTDEETRMQSCANAAPARVRATAATPASSARRCFMTVFLLLFMGWRDLGSDLLVRPED